ncbi:helix-turn-helix domain-containing protein [Thiomicrorhabdus indica]|uniref:helix-turn-helix domain-containing protein n=1 Tax=Thiomicrorhabdus indica TaxID=2267253 RepID=UPI00102DB338|nr:helix-turn-helix transcriptional regulator [Thiomicrorhabdus indica]
MSKLSVTDVDKSVGRKIQIRRKELNLTAAQLSESIGISQQQLSRYERGENKINITHLVSIAAFTQTPIGWFFTDCKPLDTGGLIQESPEIYVGVSESDLFTRMQQIWSDLTIEQQRSVINLLDQF